MEALAGRFDPSGPSDPTPRGEVHADPERKCTRCHSLGGSGQTAGRRNLHDSTAARLAYRPSGRLSFFFLQLTTKSPLKPRQPFKSGIISSIMIRYKIIRSRIIYDRASCQGPISGGTAKDRRRFLFGAWPPEKGKE